jgi:hypothetical protein
VSAPVGMAHKEKTIVRVCEHEFDASPMRVTDAPIKVDQKARKPIAHSSKANLQVVTVSLLNR